METITEFVNYAFEGFEWILISYFFLSSMYVFVFAIAGHTYKNRSNRGNSKLRKIAVFIPAYKEDSVIVEVAFNALRQQYPPSFYEVIVIADSLKKETLKKLNQLPIKVIEVFFEKSTKVKALNTAMDQLAKSYDYALVLDADNIMEPHFLTKLNDAFNRGHRVVQGHRKAKNLNTSFAILDAVSEEINNHIFRKGHSALKLSSGLIGSGMAFEYHLFKEIMSTIKAVGGFDKELEFELAKREIHIEYLQDAIVLDEKIQKASDFSSQRRRWIATQFVYLRKYFKQGWKELYQKRNVNFFDKVCQMMLPPRVLLLGFTFLTMIIYSVKELVFGFNSQVSAWLWILNFGILSIAFALSFPKSFYTVSTLKSVGKLPSAFLRMTLLLFRLKGANTKFIHTAHSAVNH
jgi:cellulose synthase/poly-beta-1,6-N-acetylglucosamine synthase-like glycosyltransferase